jgi:hypothetical protein
MENNNNAKKSFNAAEVIRRQGFCAGNITAIKEAGVTEVTVNAMGRIVVAWEAKLVMWDAPATPAGKLAAQRAILDAGLKLTGAGVLPAALPKKPAAAPKLDAPVVAEAELEAARDAKAAEKTSELLDLLDQLAEEAKMAPKEEKKKVKRTPKPRANKA